MNEPRTFSPALLKTLFAKLVREHGCQDAAAARLEISRQRRDRAAQGRGRGGRSRGQRHRPAEGVMLRLRYLYAKWRLSRFLRPINRQIADARKAHKPTAHLLQARRALIHAALAGRAG